MSPRDGAPAPALQVAGWLNAAASLNLADLRGKVVAVYAFQMLCPACVSHGIPQAKKIGRMFERSAVEVLGLHSVFEHHGVMGGRDALAAFMHEYRIDFPVAMDRPAPDDRIPLTMAQYDMRGTPTLLLIDRRGMLRHQLFGVVDDMQVGALLAQLVHEVVHEAGDTGRCDDGACSI